MPNEDDPFAELIATGALVLLVGAVIAGAIGAVEWGCGSALTSMLTGTIDRPLRDLQLRRDLFRRQHGLLHVRRTTRPSRRLTAPASRL